jgi:hypothetical protein
MDVAKSTKELLAAFINAIIARLHPRFTISVDHGFGTLFSHPDFLSGSRMAIRAVH